MLGLEICVPLCVVPAIWVQIPQRDSDNGHAPSWEDDLADLAQHITASDPAASHPTRVLVSLAHALSSLIECPGPPPHTPSSYGRTLFQLSRLSRLPPTHFVNSSAMPTTNNLLH